MFYETKLVCVHRIIIFPAHSIVWIVTKVMIFFNIESVMVNFPDLIKILIWPRGEGSPRQGHCLYSMLCQSNPPEFLPKILNLSFSVA